MVYVPTNGEVYTAAYAGMYAAILNPRSTISAVAADYSLEASVAGAFAEEFDTLYASAAPLTATQCRGIQALCEEYYAGRFPPGTPAQVSTPAYFATDVAILLAMLAEQEAYLGVNAPAALFPCAEGGRANIIEVGDFNGTKTFGYTGADYTLIGPYNILECDPLAPAAQILMGLIAGAVDGDIVEIVNSSTATAIEVDNTSVGQMGEVEEADVSQGFLNVSSERFVFRASVADWEMASDSDVPFGGIQVFVRDNLTPTATTNIKRAPALVNPQQIDNSFEGITSLGSDSTGLTVPVMGDFATIGGGDQNEIPQAAASGATIGGGTQNQVNVTRGTIGGGVLNNIAVGGDRSTIGGGIGNSVTANPNCTIGGGTGNTAIGDTSTIGGGHLNTSTGQGSFVGGGDSNSAGGVRSVIAGGDGNITVGLVAVVGGGIGNAAVGDGSTVGGGNNGLATGDNATLGGGIDNTAVGVGSFVGGGDTNTAVGVNSTVVGGTDNTAPNDGGSVLGGNTNTAGGVNATIGGGSNNITAGPGAFVGGGDSNTAAGNQATVVGGTDNTAPGAQAFIGGGTTNTASGECATIPGGNNNLASGKFTEATGNSAAATIYGERVHGGTGSAQGKVQYVDPILMQGSTPGVGANETVILALGDTNPLTLRSNKAYKGRIEWAAIRTDEVSASYGSICFGARIGGGALIIDGQSTPGDEQFAEAASLLNTMTLSAPGPGGELRLEFATGAAVTAAMKVDAAIFLCEISPTN